MIAHVSIFFSLFVISFSSNCILSQSNLTGKISDYFTEQPVSGTKISLMQNGAIVDQFISGYEGEYNLTAPEKGIYVIEVIGENQGYSPVQVQVLLDRDTNTLDCIYLGADAKELEVIIIQQKRRKESPVTCTKLETPITCNWPPDNYDSSNEHLSRREKRKQKSNNRRNRKQ